MSESNKSAAYGLLKFTSSVSTLGVFLYSYADLPESATGLKGLYAAMLVTFGTSIVSNCYAIGAGLSTGTAGALLSVPGSRLRNGINCLALGGLIALPFGIAAGYPLAKDTIVNGIAPAHANAAPVETPAAPAAPAPNVPQI